jgi:predicted Zn-ribbon and HTH transcriptional regulator
MEPFDDRQTIRQEIISLLSSEELTIRDLSQAVSLPEKEIVGHLDHIERSLQRQKKKLMITPYKCLTCGFTFDKRTRFTKPGRCPDCKNSHIQVAQFYIK